MVKKLASIFVLFGVLFALAACTITTTQKSETTTTQEQTDDENPINISFSLDEHVSVIVYKTQNVEEAETTSTSYARDADTGLILSDGDGQINFKIIIDEGYQLSNILVTPSSNYKNIKGPDETLVDDVYRITKITGELTVTISTALKGTNLTIDGFSVTFVTDTHTSLSVYTTSDYSTLIEDENDFVSRDSDTGEALENGEGQVNFKLAFEDGYTLSGIYVSPVDSVKSIKYPTDTSIINGYRITKITSDIVVTITSKAKVSTDDYDPLEPTVITLNDEDTTVVNNNGGVTYSQGILAISEGGTYEIYGTLNGSIGIFVVDESDVVLNFYDVTLTSSENAPIYVEDAGEVTLSFKEGTTTNITDSRDSGTDYDALAAIYSNTDLTIKGNGTLTITASYNNGIATKDDLDIKNITLNIVAENHGLKGNDSVTIHSGIINITAKTGDGIKTENTDISDSGNQRGIITISGGVLVINAASDGIDAAYDVLIEDSPEITIYTTSTYATNVDQGSASSSDVFYLKLNSTVYSTSKKIVLYVYNTDSAEFLSGTYLGSVRSFDGTSYYFSYSLPSGYSNFVVYQYNVNDTPSLTSYTAKSDASSMNQSFNMISISRSGISSGVISFSFSNYQTSQSGPGGQTGGNQSVLDYSAKGVKANNEIYISGGTIVIASYDDGIHANSDTVLDDGEYGLGNIIITGGSITVTTKDDGIHADSTLSISGGSIQVLTSYEGIEGNVILISGGNMTVFATDDGLNASSGSDSPQIIISGGLVDVSTGTGDTDAIDSNGSYTQTGGYVTSRSALSGGMGGALDTDGKASITGGTFVGIGTSEVIASSAGNNRSTGRISISVTGGDYQVLDSSGNVLFEFSTSSSYTYSSMWISSDLFTSGQTYSIVRNNTTEKTWTQS